MSTANPSRPNRNVLFAVAIILQTCLYCALYVVWIFGIWAAIEVISAK